MLLFSTVLDIKDTLTKDAFIQLVIEWNQKSYYEENIIHGIQWNGEHNIRFEDGDLWMDIEEYRDKDIIAVRYEKKNDRGVIWDTDYVMNFRQKKMAIRLDRSFAPDAVDIDSSFSTPYFISLLIERGYLKDDGRLPVLKDPIQIAENNMDLLADVINGKARYKLPVVYVSRTHDNEDPIDTMHLARRLKGVAHVLVEQDLSLNDALKEACDWKNEYFGAVGIYYPNQSVPHDRYMYRTSYHASEILASRVIRQVIRYCGIQRIDSLYTWQGVNNALLSEQLENQRAQRTAAEKKLQDSEKERLQLRDNMNEEERRFREETINETNQLLASFDEENNDLNKRVQELIRANEALRSENDNLKAMHSASDAKPVLYMGDEEEFYPGEVKDQVVKALKDALPNLEAKSRRADVVKDVIKNNPCTDEAEKFEETMRHALAGYKIMNERIIQELKNAGFTVSMDGSHCKIRFHDDGRYTFVLAKTPSDGRSGENNAKTICRKLL